ncbi:MAG: adenylate/guanylate cyclase domain-containing protein [Gammaproteobacteria bacterium]|jgi:class 3 adenylate cyclase|nr:adenylate/guanylate cyclase domain-containing protein [Gammaproteobacteria bacterium]MBT3724935.1 adenylate/guanylate cyclase domain-containing protein [Gammaproteobacteria bacterium]MBT4078724.1 adenylate/guanylate cyclase domain-containing protein [Gammaproteobacteria bacterium]MBT4449948.1 adenylate/guanylate cyclase domain-containing protein [Gammaproteobacteria bacterium]MBT4862078.1 adenylate/guanylate cyclase domain-containing protein [Gammaproteobacteria bacterium]
MTQATILFADIAGSTALYENIGDSQAENLINTVLAALSGIVEEHNGLVIKTIGDEIMCQFSSSSEAIQAANQMHEYTEQVTFPEHKQKIAIRIGAHIGTIIRNQGDIFGDTVNVSARVASLARPGKTMISEQTYETLPNYLQQFCRNMIETYLKGKEQPINVYDVVWEQNDQLTRIAQIPLPSKTVSSFTLNYNDQKVKLTQGSIKIGRGSECDLVVEAPQASRFHCEIQLKGNKFILIDSSTNGTYISQNNVEILFNNETVPLHHSGIISLGQISNSNSEHLIKFLIEID